MGHCWYWGIRLVAVTGKWFLAWETEMQCGTSPSGKGQGKRDRFVKMTHGRLQVQELFSLCHWSPIWWKTSDVCPCKVTWTCKIWLSFLCYITSIHLSEISLWFLTLSYWRYCRAWWLRLIIQFPPSVGDRLKEGSQTLERLRLWESYESCITNTNTVFFYRVVRMLAKRKKSHGYWSCLKVIWPFPRNVN